MKLIGVRLGEHDLSTERDCDRDADGLEVVCAERYQDFDIENIHFHPGFSPLKLQNDIALLRLNRDADFGPQNVRPICMPIGSAANLIQKKVNTVVKYEHFFKLFFNHIYYQYYVLWYR